MPRGDPQPGDSGLAHERRPLVAESHVPRQVAGLPGLDGRGGEHGADGGDVGDEVVALVVIARDEVGRLGEGGGGVGFAFAWWKCQY